MRKTSILAATTLALTGLQHMPTAMALPHGCASVTSDASFDVDLFRRRVGTRIYRDQPCTFYFSAGDTFTGNGRFLVECASGGRLYHLDHEGDTPEHSERLVPIPQPCAVGDLVTIDGFHPGTGGSIVAGGLGEAETGSTRPLADPADTLTRPSPNSDFASLCDADHPSVAAVSLTKPVARSGLLAFGGTVDCRGAAVAITSVTITGVGGYPSPAHAGTAGCWSCRKPVSVSGTVPAQTTQYDVEMTFDVTRRGKPAVHAYRLGRYVASWAGHITPLYPTPSDDGALVT